MRVHAAREALERDQLQERCTSRRRGEPEADGISGGAWLPLAIASLAPFDAAVPPPRAQEEALRAHPCAATPGVPRRAMRPAPRGAWVSVVGFVVAWALACSEPGSTPRASEGSGPVAAEVVLGKRLATSPTIVLPPLDPAAVRTGEARLAELRVLARLPSDGPERAERLFGLVASTCTSTAGRLGLAHAIAAAQADPTDLGGQQGEEALDVFELVAASCDRNAPDDAQAFAAALGARLPELPRIDLVSARLHFAHQALDAAEARGRAARDKGSIAALPFLATVQAARARVATSSTAVRAGLEAAARTVDVEPQAAWRLIDLTAVLSTRARLHTELALWTDGTHTSTPPLVVADQLYGRLSRQPFITVTRAHALDLACFEAPRLVPMSEDARTACARAALETSNLGGAFLAGLGLDPKQLDARRLEAIQGFEAALSALPPRRAVFVVVRGDESELVAWARPAALVVERVVAERHPIVVVDRTRSLAARAIVGRLLALAGAEATRLEAGAEPLALPCAIARARGAPGPTRCALPADAARVLERLGRDPETRVGAALLVGRDLLAEVEDMEAAALPHALLSLRQLPNDRRAAVHLMAASDTWLLARDAPERAGQLALPREALRAIEAQVARQRGVAPTSP
jgi:hypothetical protein